MKIIRTYAKKEEAVDTVNLIKRLLEVEIEKIIKSKYANIK